MTEIETILLVNHCHTDIGYTHDQSVLWDLQRRFIDDGIAAAERDKEKDSADAFHWTIETTGPLLQWLETVVGPVLDSEFVNDIRYRCRWFEPGGVVRPENGARSNLKSVWRYQRHSNTESGVPDNYAEADCREYSTVTGQSVICQGPGVFPRLF